MSSTTMLTPPTAYLPYQLSVQEYVIFREQGYLVVRGLVDPAEVAELAEHTDNLRYGHEIIPGVPLPPANLSPDQKIQHWLRVHMLHRVSAIHERFLLHPRILDVLEALIGPDVLALQTMLFFKQPGQPGQGYHQDSYYIPTFPDTLIGAWLAIDHADEENGCMWMTVGSQHEPVYPDSDGVTDHGDRLLGDLQPIFGASNTDENANGLTRVAKKYPGREIAVPAAPGDVVFFGGHVLHRSHENRSPDRLRRSFVAHYCNAHSWVPWNHGAPFPSEGGNALHILARGGTHLPYAQPRFGTSCAANTPQPTPPHPRGERPVSMMPGANDLMILTAHPDMPSEDGID
jgi:ectoine hydroxylase-related dioxygenase (phytanoyl-CoA dioxygenase family)